MSDRELMRRMYNDARKQRVAELTEHFKKKYPGESEAKTKQRVARRMAWEELNF